MEDSTVEAIKALKLENADGEAMAYVSHRSLEQTRRKTIATSFPDCEGSGDVVAVVGKDAAGNLREFIAVLKGSPLVPELVMGSCQITYEDLSPSECIEYAFAEAPTEWAMAQLSREALETYRGMKFEAWKQMLTKPTCEAQFRRMLQIGLVTRLYDPHVFPTPESMKAQYQVTDERSGKLIELPHPVQELRFWSAQANSYEKVDTVLGGAPSEAEAKAWWDEFMVALRKEHGDEYITGLLSGK